MQPPEIQNVKFIFEILKVGNKTCFITWIINWVTSDKIRSFIHKLLLFSLHITSRKTCLMSLLWESEPVTSHLKHRNISLCTMCVCVLSLWNYVSWFMSELYFVRNLYILHSVFIFRRHLSWLQIWGKGSRTSWISSWHSKSFWLRDWRRVV